MADNDSKNVSSCSLVYGWVRDQSESRQGKMRARLRCRSVREPATVEIARACPIRAQALKDQGRVEWRVRRVLVWRLAESPLSAPSVQNCYEMPRKKSAAWCRMHQRTLTLTSRLVFSRIDDRDPCCDRSAQAVLRERNRSPVQRL